jgi:hypothetical protein
MNSRSDGMKHGIATRLSQRGNSHMGSDSSVEVDGHPDAPGNNRLVSFSPD